MKVIVLKIDVRPVTMKSKLQPCFFSFFFLTDWLHNYRKTRGGSNERVLLKPPITDPPTFYDLPTDPPTTYPPTHLPSIMNLL